MVAGNEVGERPPKIELHELGEDALATIHVQTQYEDSTCAREVGETNQLVSTNSSLGHTEITTPSEFS